MTTTTRSLRYALGILIACAMAAPAQDGAADVMPEGWESGLALGATLNRGNSETMLGNISLTSDFRKGPTELSLAAEGNYGESEIERDGETYTETNVSNAKGTAAYRYLFDDLDYGLFTLELLTDDIADIDHRITVGPGGGRYFIKNDATALAGEVGVVYIGEKLGGVTDDRAALRVAQRLEHQVSASAKVWEKAEYLPTVDDFGQYLLNAEAGAEAAMTGQLSLRIVAQYKYNSDPAEDKKSDDLTLIAGINYAF